MPYSTTPKTHNPKKPMKKGYNKGYKGSKKSSNSGGGFYRPMDTDNHNSDTY